MTQTDKEKIEEALKEIYEISTLKAWDLNGKELPEKFRKKLEISIDDLEKIKKILEKRSLTDEQGYQEALELDEEERLVLLKKEEKLEAIKEMIDELGGRRSLLPMADVLNKIEIMLKGSIRLP